MKHEVLPYTPDRLGSFDREWLLHERRGRRIRLCRTPPGRAEHKALRQGQNECPFTKKIHSWDQGRFIGEYRFYPSDKAGSMRRRMSAIRIMRRFPPAPTEKSLSRQRCAEPR